MTKRLSISLSDEMFEYVQNLSSRSGASASSVVAMTLLKQKENEDAISLLSQFMTVPGMAEKMNKELNSNEEG